MQSNQKMKSLVVGTIISNKLSYIKMITVNRAHIRKGKK